MWGIQLMAYFAPEYLGVRRGVNIIEAIKQRGRREVGKCVSKAYPAWIFNPQAHTAIINYRNVI